MTEQSDDVIEIVDTHEVYGGWSKLLVATLRLPDGRTIKREIEDHGEAVCVLPYHPQRKTAVLVRQWRVPVLYASNQRQHLLEAVAGVIEDVDAATCAHREVMEEALLKLDSLEPVFTAFTMPGLSTEYMHFFLATYSGEPRPEMRGGVDEDEYTVAVEIRLAELARMADENRLPDTKTLLLLQTLRLRRPELFV
ncbi:MAG TPA: NUDIX hydrolase [Xanthobacteraceae bacterium]|jgi:nudix-type nucleoside diphosphatase (YffH/AdpP family)|nr:NUDIX hydrolase [Xanthobacteraceae bacterium]